LNNDVWASKYHHGISHETLNTFGVHENKASADFMVWLKASANRANASSAVFLSPQDNKAEVSFIKKWNISQCTGLQCSFGTIPLGSWFERSEKMSYIMAKQAKDENWEAFGTDGCPYHDNYTPNPKEKNRCKLDYGHHCALYSVVEGIFNQLP
jgi:hypothetical protein